MTDKNEFVEKLQNQIEEWKCEMKSLEEKAEGASEEVKAKCGEAMDALRCQCEAGETKLEEWKAKADDAWEDFQKDAEETFAAFKASTADSIEKIKSFFA